MIEQEAAPGWPQSPMRLLLRVMGTYLLLAGLFNLFEVQLERPLAPLVAIGFMATRAEPVSVSIEHRRIAIALSVARSSNHDDREARSEQAAVQVHAPANTLLVPPLILLTGLLAGPTRSVRERSIATCIGLVLVALIVMVDLPCATSAAISEKLAADRGPASDFAAFWWFFLDNGGRQLLAIVATLASLLGARCITTRFITTRPHADSAVGRA